MPIEFIGAIRSRLESEIFRPTGPILDVDFVRQSARLHEDAGFDRALLNLNSAGPDGFVIAADVFARTEHLGIMLAHRPGFIFPTVAARKLATLDQLSGGRLGVHIISGGSDQEQRRDGDYLDHDTRYRRTEEYLEILRQTWTETTPFDHEGEFYKFENFVSGVQCFTQPHIPVYFGGSSDAALEVAARYADIYAFWGEPLADAKAHIERVKAAAAVYGREPGFSLSLRPILGVTEEKAWERAYEILSIVQGNVAKGNLAPRMPQNVGSLRLIEAAKRGDIQDKRLFTPLAAATNGGGNSTALVGTPEQVAESLLDYIDIGVTTLLIRGYDPADDPNGYKEVISIVRDEVAHRDGQVAQAS
jgi:alkanesulfonate monooxygenase